MTVSGGNFLSMFRRPVLSNGPIIYQLSAKNHWAEVPREATRRPGNGTTRPVTSSGAPSAPGAPGMPLFPNPPVPLVLDPSFPPKGPTAPLLPKSGAAVLDPPVPAEAPAPP